MDKKLLKELKRDMCYDSDSYYGYIVEDEDGERYFEYGEPSEDDVEIIYDNDLAIEDYEYLLNEYGFLEGIIDGGVNLWNGFHNIEPRIMTFKEVLNSLRDTERLVLKFDDKARIIEIENHHHDGTNYYEFQPFDLMTRPQLYNLARDLKEKYKINEPISKYSVDELIYFIKENL